MSDFARLNGHTGSDEINTRKNLVNSPIKVNSITWKDDFLVLKLNHGVPVMDKARRT